MSTSLLLLEIPGPGAPVGDCTIKHYEGHIVLESFSWELKEADKEKTGTAGRRLEAGKVKIGKAFDRASAALRKRMERPVNTTQFHYDSAVIRFLDPTTNRRGNSIKFESIMEFELRGVFIDEISVRVSDAGKDVTVKEEVTLSFKKAALVRYYAETITGQRNRATEFKFDLPYIGP